MAIRAACYISSLFSAVIAALWAVFMQHNNKDASKKLLLAAMALLGMNEPSILHWLDKDSAW